MFKGKKKPYKWLRYPENIPAKPGYYYTLYYNPEQQSLMLKAFFWTSNDEWTFKPDVRGFVEESYNQYYVPSQTWGQQNFNQIDGFKQLDTTLTIAQNEARIKA